MTDTTTQTLADFLLDRIAEDEAAARAAATDGLHPSGDWWAKGSWWLEGVEMLTVGKGNVGSDLVAYTYVDVDRTHIARHDPARVLAECAAKRRIAELEDDEAADSPPYYSALQDVLRALANVYADHAEFREEWAL